MPRRNPRPKALPTPGQKPGVLFQPAVSRSFQRGARRVLDAVLPTLGPLPRLAALERTHRADAPELLDDAGLIARRIIQLPDRDEDIGAMFVRQMLWRQREEVGDGAATTAALFKAIYDEGIKYISAGCNPMRLRSGLERALPVVLAALEGQARPLAGREQVTAFARTACPDDTLTGYLGEIFDIIGTDGLFYAQLGYDDRARREYVEGHLWKGGLISQQLMLEPVRWRSRLEETAILASDFEIETASQLTPVLRAALQAGERSLVILARKLSDEAAALLLKVNRDSGRMRVTAVKTPGTGQAEQFTALEDLCCLAGGRAFIQAAGESFEKIAPADFGHARQAWADMERFVVVNGRGDPRLLREHLRRLKQGAGDADTPEKRRSYRERAGRLLGGTAILSAGGTNDSERKARRDLAERAAQTLRAALAGGVVPGGGVALIDCRPALEAALPGWTEEDELLGGRALVKALDAPARVILSNSGLEPARFLSRMGRGVGADVRSGDLADLHQRGIEDPAAVVREALFSAVRSAALALTVEVIVHQRSPEASVNP